MCSVNNTCINSWPLTITLRKSKKINIRALSYNVTKILPGCSHISTTVPLHHLDSNEASGEKAWWELYKNAACYFEQILEAAPHKTAFVLSLTADHSNHPSKTDMLGMVGEICIHRIHLHERDTTQGLFLRSLNSAFSLD